jgi:branched-subunit amino acid transport protein
LFQTRKKLLDLLTTLTSLISLREQKRAAFLLDLRAIAPASMAVLGRSALLYAPLAALVATIVPDVLSWTEQAGPQFDLKFLAAGVSLLVFLATRNG